MSVSVTFDSNVWECIVDEDKRENSDPIVAKLFMLIKFGMIKPFFFEGIVTMESVKKKDRKDYIGSYKPNILLVVGDEVMPPPPIKIAFEPSEYLKKTIPKALELGFRFTKLPRIGAPKINLPEQYFATDEKYEMGERQKRSSDCANFIYSLGAGKAAIMNGLSKSNGGVVQRTKADHFMSEKNFSNAYGEWVDGDALAANYGYGIDYFCTNDRASNAGKSSIFFPDNLAKLEKRFPVNVVSPDVLLIKLSNGNS